MEIKKVLGFFGALALLLAAPAALASTPTLSAVLNSDGDSVQLTVTGDANSSVILYYTKTNVGQLVSSIGNTGSNGNLITTISTSGYGIVADSIVYVTVGGLNGARSASVTWPKSSGSGNLALSQTGLAMSVGQSATLTITNNSGGSVYLSNNSNPPVANVSISGGQATVSAVSYGSTVVTFCSTASSSSCASAYVTVQNGGSQPLTFNVNNVTIAPNQSVPVTVSGGNGSYTILNNSNSSVIQTNISGATVTLSTSASSGSSAITVCSSDMLSCGIINASAGSSSTVPVSFSQTNPTISLGQSLNISLSGGNSASYYLSSNSNSAAVQASISGSVLTIVGNTNGSSTLSVCSSSGSCGFLTVTVQYVSSGGTIQLSQNTISLLVGQVMSVTVTGGSTPYNLGTYQSSLFQASLNSNIVTISGLSAGSGVLNVCSAGGSCASLTVVVNNSGSGTPMSFSQSTLSLSPGSSGAVTITGAGGYYVSNSSNPAVASVLISGSTAIVTGNSTGNDNVSICQSGGQCAILFVTVSSSASSNSIPTFSPSSPSVAAGQSVNVSISSASAGNYYVSANSNTSVATVSLNNSILTVSGQSSGTATIVVCASSGICGPLTVTVIPAGSSSISLSPATASLAVGQNFTVNISGGSGYYVSANSNQSVAGAQLSGSVLTISGLAAGSSSVGVCQSNGQCATLPVTVSDSSSGSASSTSPAGSGSSAQSVYSSGQLISENGTIYIVYKNTKVGFANAKAFLGLGFKFSDVTAAGSSGLAVSERVVTSASGAHPRGAWVLSGKTVYFVTPDGLIPVPTWDIFLSNGGQADFLVKANAADLTFPKLYPMTAGDTRVK